MSLKDFLDVMARFVWPVLCGILAFLFVQMQDFNAGLYEFRLHVAENYTSKQDLKEMLSALEGRMDKRFSQLLTTLTKQ